MTPFGRYTLVRKLATGGMAEVFLANADGPMGFQKKCVVKRILPHFSDDQGFVEMFLAEARLAAELNHPNLVQIFDFGEVNGQYFIAMEYIDGPNLRILNREVRVSQGPMPMPLAARILTLAAEGLHFAHELKDERGQPINLVHRDISPDNILVSRQGTVKVVDFGIAKAANQPHLTKSGMIKGKLAYMPPEQMAREPLDRRADIYALGIVLYELVCGGMPFDATSEVSIIQALMGSTPLQRASDLRPDVDPELDGIIAKCLAKNRDERYASCRELQHDLERYIVNSGTVIALGDISHLVEQTLADSLAQTTPEAPMPLGGTDTGLELTAPRNSTSRETRPAAKPIPPIQLLDEKRPTNPGQPARQTRATDQQLGATSQSSGTSLTSMRPVPQLRSRTPLFVGLGVGAALIAVTVAAVMLKSAPPPEVPVIDAGPAKVEPIPAPVVDAGPPAVIDAGPPAEPPDAGPPVVDAGAPAIVSPRTVTVGRLDLRVRPHALVTIDGKDLGDTPIEVQVLKVGMHKVKLTNPELGKSVVLDVKINPGDNVQKYNFKD
jgi:serine/threonine-protein kinase